MDPGSSTFGDKVAIYGGARTGTAAPNIWGANFLATQDADDPDAHVQGVEIDVNSNKADYQINNPKVMIGLSIISGGTYGAGWGLNIGYSQFANRWLDGIRIAPVRRLGLEIDTPDPVFYANMAARQPSNGADSIVLQRRTDVAPSGFFMRAVNAANNANLFWITSTGGMFALDNVGVGTTTPTAKLHVAGNFIATGLKSAVVDTKTYGQRELYAVESSESWFEDFGSATLAKGAVTVQIDPMFGETVNTDVDYHVFLTPNGPCTLYIEEKERTHFSVRSSSGDGKCRFDYRIVAKRAGYERVRLASHPLADIAMK